MPSPVSPGGSPEPLSPPWREISEDPEFRRLLRRKARFIVPATVFFLAYYIALPVLVGFAPDLMSRPLWGELNAAYLFALSQFFMAWLLAGIYVGVAAGWDRQAEEILKKFARS